MPRSESQKESRRRYNKKCRRLAITLYPTESDIIAKIDSVEHYAPYIKALIRADIESSDDGR